MQTKFATSHDGSQVRLVGHADVVAFEGFKESLGRPIFLGALHRSCDLD